MWQNSKTSSICTVSPQLQFLKFVALVYKYGTGSYKLDLERKETVVCDQAKQIFKFQQF